MDASTINLIIAAAIPLFGAILTGLVGVGVALAYQKLGLQQTQADLQRDQAAQAAIQAAMLTGAGLLATQGRDAAVKYVIATVPDAIAHFGLSASDIAQRVVAKAAGLAGLPAYAPLGPVAAATS